MRLPPIGFGLPSDGRPHTEREEQRVLALRPVHLRADVDATDLEALVEAFRMCTSVGAELELALHVDASNVEAIDGLRHGLSTGPLARVLVFQRGEETTPRATIDAARARLPDGISIVGGTDANFCDVNRDRPDVTGLDGVAYSINSQVHAFDELSLVEALAGHADTVRSAHVYFPGVPVVVSPVTLRPRFNPAAVAEELSSDEPELPSAVDPRQMSQFAAAWTLGSIKALGEAGASSLTYYETTGWRGLFERDAGNPQPDLFPSTPGMVFPVFGLFETLAGLGGAELLDLVAADPLRIVGLALRQDHGVTLLVGNLTRKPIILTLNPHGRVVELDPYGIQLLSPPGLGSVRTKL